MKKLKIALISMLAAMLLCVLPLVAACGNGDTGNTDENGDDAATTYYTLTLKYESKQGAVAVNGPAAEKGYVAGEKVSVSVKPNDGYAVKAVKANATALTLGEDGKYSFSISQNTTVEVTFQLAEDDDGDLSIDSLWAGSWKSIDGGTKFVIAADGAQITDNGETVAATDAEGTADSLTLTGKDGKTYALTWYDSFVANKIMILTEGEEKHYLIPDGAPAVNVDFNGKWYDLLAANTLTIDAANGTAAFNGQNALAVVNCGFCDQIVNNDGSTATIGHDCLYLVMEDGGDIYFIGWYTDNTTAGQPNGRAFNNPTVTTPATSETPLTHRSFIELYVDEDLAGTWENVKGDVTIAVDPTAKTVKVNNENAEVYNNGGTRGAGNIIIYKGQAYRLEPDPGYNYYLTRETIVDLGMGRRDYFLKDDHEPAKVTENILLDTEWEGLTVNHTLKIDAQGNVSYDNAPYTVFVAEKLDNGQYKVIAVSSDNNKLEFSYDPVQALIMCSASGNNEAFVKKTAGGQTKTGFLGLPIGVYLDSMLTRVEVTADSLIIYVDTFNFFDDDPLTVTEDMLLVAPEAIYGSSAHYTFGWTDLTNGNLNTVHIAIDVTAPSYVDGLPYHLMVAFGDYDEHFFIKK